MRLLLFGVLALAGCCSTEVHRDSKLQVHYIVGGGVLVTGPVYHTIIREDGSVLDEIKNRIED